jgi:hypothetical protein
VYTPIGVLYLSTGQVRRMFVWACIAIPITVLGFFVGLEWGPLGVAISYTLSNAVLLVPGLAFAIAISPVKAKDITRATLRPAFVAGVIWASLAALAPLRSELDGMTYLLLGLTTSLAVFAFAVGVMYRPAELARFVRIR